MKCSYLVTFLILSVFSVSAQSSKPSFQNTQQEILQLLQESPKKENPNEIIIIRTIKIKGCDANWLESQLLFHEGHTYTRSQLQKRFLATKTKLLWNLEFYGASFLILPRKADQPRSDSHRTIEVDVERGLEFQLMFWPWTLSFDNLQGPDHPRDLGIDLGWDHQAIRWAEHNLEGSNFFASANLTHSVQDLGEFYKDNWGAVLGGGYNYNDSIKFSCSQSATWISFPESTWLGTESSTLNQKISWGIQQPFLITTSTVSLTLTNPPWFGSPLIGSLTQGFSFSAENQREAFFNTFFSQNLSLNVNRDSIFATDISLSETLTNTQLPNYLQLTTSAFEGCTASLYTQNLYLLHFAMWIQNLLNFPMGSVKVDMRPTLIFDAYNSDTKNFRIDSIWPSLGPVIDLYFGAPVNVSVVFGETFTKTNEKILPYIVFQVLSGQYN